jgi:uncharacterized membrane protein
MRKPTDHELDLSVAAMLRVGVTLAALVVLIGGILSLRYPWTLVPDYSRFQVAGPSIRTVAGILHGVAQGSSASIMQLGLLLLIATPVARVAFCVVGFARQRDSLYVLVSASVLAVLLYSLIRDAR